MGTADRRPTHYFVSFGDQLLDGPLQVGEGGKCVRLEELFEALTALLLAWRRIEFYVIFGDKFVCGS